MLDDVSLAVFKLGKRFGSNFSSRSAWLVAALLRLGSLGRVGRVFGLPALIGVRSDQISVFR